MSATGRVRLPDAPAPGMFQVISLGGDNSSSNNNSNNQIREYKRRRPHKKTRAGCLGCKQRRVKCDQAQPVCLRCRRNQRQCVYEGAEPAPASGSRPKGQQPEDTQDQASVPGISSAAKINRLAVIRSEGKRQQPPPQDSGNYTGGHARAYTGHNRSPAQGNVFVQAAPVAPQIPPARFIRPHPFQVTGQELGTPANELFYHFEVMGTSLFGMPNFMGPILPLALQFPHLRGTALASAAAHLTHTAPGVKNYHIAKHYQESLALNAYQSALITPFVVQGQLGIDVLLMTAMLMNMLSFVMPLDENESRVVWDGTISGPPPPCADPDPDPRRSWVFSTHPNRLGWLALQMGLTPLLIATAPWREKSRLRLLFANSDDEQRTLSGTWQSLRRVPQPWLELFGFDRYSPPRPNYRGSGVTSRAPSTWPPSQTRTTSHSGAEDTDMDAATDTTKPDRSTPGATVSGPGTPASTASTSTTGSHLSSAASNVEDTMSEAERLYRAPLRVVSELVHIEPSERSMLQYFQFIGQLSNDFRQKLYERDEKALWLFGMWMGLLCRFDNVWWTRRRTRCDFRAIRLWLHLVGVGQRPGREGQMWRQLLQDLDDTWGYSFETDPVMHRM